MIAENGTLNNQVDKKGQALSELEQENDQMKSRIEALEDELQALQSDHKFLSSQIQLENSSKVSLYDYQQVSQELYYAKSELSSLYAKISSLESDKTQL